MGKAVGVRVVAVREAETAEGATAVVMVVEVRGLATAVETVVG